MTNIDTPTDTLLAARALTLHIVAEEHVMSQIEQIADLQSRVEQTEALVYALMVELGCQKVLQPEHLQNVENEASNRTGAGPADLIKRFSSFHRS